MARRGTDLDRLYKKFVARRDTEGSEGPKKCVTRCSTQAGFEKAGRHENSVFQTEASFV